MHKNVWMSLREFLLVISKMHKKKKENPKPTAKWAAIEAGKKPQECIKWGIGLPADRSESHWVPSLSP